MHKSLFQETSAASSFQTCLKSYLSQKENFKRIRAGSSYSHIRYAGKYKTSLAEDGEVA